MSFLRGLLRVLCMNAPAPTIRGKDSGTAASVVRGFRAVYLGVVFNVVIMASVNLAAAKIANVLLGWPIGQTLLVCGVLNVAFAATSGLWGVLSSLGQATAAVAADSSVTFAMIAISVVAIAALAALQRLLGSDEESFQ